MIIILAKEELVGCLILENSIIMLQQSLLIILAKEDFQISLNLMELLLETLIWTLEVAKELEWILSQVIIMGLGLKQNQQEQK